MPLAQRSVSREALRLDVDLEVKFLYFAIIHEVG